MKPQKQENVADNWRHRIHDSRIHHRYDSVVKLFWRQLECPLPWRERMSLWFMPSRWECLSWGLKNGPLCKIYDTATLLGFKMLRFINSRLIVNPRKSQVFRIFKKMQVNIIYNPEIIAPNMAHCICNQRWFVGIRMAKTEHSPSRRWENSSNFSSSSCCL